ncbi:hypothetical protein ACJMK2_040441 [Sinanodonta woodiana]|uniref:Uncharacterized protein n=1 Tax=Sinanodonta woodiana TaxID=1069815 RepID=A0ABD3W118_SINWO
MGAKLVPSRQNILTPQAVPDKNGQKRKPLEPPFSLLNNRLHLKEWRPSMTRKEAARQKGVMDEESAIFKTEMNLLQTKKELASAEAEARVYEMDEAGSQVIEDGPPQLTTDYSDKINDYIKQQSQLIDKGNIADVKPDTSTLARLHSSQKPKLSKLSAGAPEFVPTSHDERQGDLVISQNQIRTYRWGCSIQPCRMPQL